MNLNVAELLDKYLEFIIAIKIYQKILLYVINDIIEYLDLQMSKINQIWLK